MESEADPGVDLKASWVLCGFSCGSVVVLLLGVPVFWCPGEASGGFRMEA